MFLGICILIVIVGIIVGYRETSKKIATPSPQTNQTKILKESLSQLEQIFEKMRIEGKWDTNKPLVWGYYFYDEDPEKLQRFRQKLKEKGFTTPEVRQSATYATDNLYLLYIYEETIHTPQSLFNRSTKHGEFAEENNIDQYDGWEVGQEPLYP